MSKTTRPIRPSVPRPDDFPLLATFFRAYLHEDFVVEHGSPVRALKAYLGDLRPADRQALAAESARLLADLAETRLPGIRRLLAGTFRSAWEPGTRDEVLDLLHAARQASGTR